MPLSHLLMNITYNSADLLSESAKFFEDELEVKTISMHASAQFMQVRLGISGEVCEAQRWTRRSAYWE